MSLFSPYSIGQLLKFLALGAIIYLTWLVRDPVVATMSVLIIGTLIASEGFILMLTRSIRKEPTDENVVKLLMLLVFKDRGFAEKILEDYRKEKEEKVKIAEIGRGIST